MIISFYNMGGSPSPGPTPTPTGDTASTALLNSIVDGSVTTVHLGTGCTYIREEGFVGCTNLVSITMDSVSGIGNGAFLTCSGLSTVEFSSALTEIGEYAFSNQSVVEDWALSHLIFNNPEPPTIGSDAFHATIQPVLIDCPAAGLSAYTSIDWSSYGIDRWSYDTDKPEIVNYKTLDENEITPSGVTPEDNFHYASGVCYMTFASALTDVPTAFMSGATGLTQVEFNDAVTGIGANAFTDCTSLVSADLGGTQSIGNGAFSGCSGLVTMIFRGSVPQYVGSNAFDGLPSAGTIFCPASAESAFQSWLGGISAISGWSVNNWVRLDSIDNETPFDAIAWTTFYEDYNDRWVSELSGLTTEEMDLWGEGGDENNGWFGDHRWNYDVYGFSYDHDVSIPEGGEMPEWVPAQDAEIATLPNVKISVSGQKYDTYMLDLTTMQNFIPLYGASSDPSWYTAEEGRGSVLVRLVQAQGQ